MKTWQQVSNQYPLYLKNKIKVPKLRLAALAKIEYYFRLNYPNYLRGDYVFTNVDKQDLKNKYEVLKGSILNGAEKQVFNDFYKLAQLH